MARSSREAEIKKATLAYLKIAEHGDPARYPIDVRNVARRIGCSPTLIYKYGLDSEISSARERQVTNNPAARKASKRQKEKNAMRLARQEAEKQIQVNKGLVARLALVEYNAARLGIDPEELYRPMPKPIRSTSRAGFRKRTSKRSR
jgi:hypothetical protein